MLEWIKENFIYDDEYFYYKSFGCGIDFFITTFGEAELTLDSLKNVDPKDVYGWHQYFEVWEEDGLLK